MMIFSGSRGVDIHRKNLSWDFDDFVISTFGFFFRTCLFIESKNKIWHHDSVTFYAHWNVNRSHDWRIDQPLNDCMDIHKYYTRVQYDKYTRILKGGKVDDIFPVHSDFWERREYQKKITTYIYITFMCPTCMFNNGQDIIVYYRNH